MALRKTTLKRLEHEAIVKGAVETLFIDNEDLRSTAGEIINTILCEHLTTRECKAIILKAALRNKGTREEILHYLNNR